MRYLWKKCLLAVGILVLTLGTAVETRANTEEASATAAAVSSTEIEINWSSIEKAKKYEIYRNTSSGGEFKRIASVSGTTTSYQDSGIKEAENYIYRVVPIEKTTGKEMSSAQMTATAKTTQKTQVSKITVKSSTKMKLNWKAAKNASGYQIYRAGKKNGKYQLIGTVNGRNTLTYTDKTVTAGKTYYYKVRPIVLTNKMVGYGSYSDPVKGKTIDQTTIQSITSVNSNAMEIAWKKVKDAVGYEVYRSTSADSGFKKIADVKSSVKKYTDKNLKSGKEYYYKIVTLGKLDGQKISSDYSKTASYRALQQVTITSVKATVDGDLKITWNRVTGATKYKIYRATSQNGTYKKITTVTSTGENTQSYTDKSVKEGKTYYYKVQACSSDDGVIIAGSGDKSESRSVNSYYAIMGKSSVTVNQMVTLYKKSGRKYPSSVYKGKGAKDIQKFCEILLDECEKEGVKAEVIFAQVCLETGYLQFGGQVSVVQCNFSGLGATDDGAAGATFPDVRTGIRAQVQHLKGYASTESLKQKCVDPRFSYLKYRRGSAKYVQSLGNGNWATDPNYASKLMNLIKLMKSY